ncbi:O-antigen ligase family protein [Rossellomorea oryzaecorticis]|uniref:O-antigen ligase family protein n=1 Tax=Rossellomorea oryzaecorticis TaxID=1396505 RepID=A0ABU9K3W8_9BACI
MNLYTKYSPLYLICFLIIGIVAGIGASAPKLVKFGTLLFFAITLIGIFLLLFKKSLGFFYTIFISGIVLFENNFKLGGIGVIDLFVMSSVFILLLYFPTKNNTYLETSTNKKNFIISVLFTIYFAFSTVGIIEYEGSFLVGISKSLIFEIPYISLYFLITIVLISRDNVLKVIKVLIAFATIASIIAIIQYVSNGTMLSGLITNFRYLGLFNEIPLYKNTADIQHLRAFVPETNKFRAHGTFYAHNLFAALIGSTIILSFIFLKEKIKKKWKVYYLLTITIQFLALVFTSSRGGVLTSAFCIGLLYFLNYKKNVFSSTMIKLILVIIISSIGLIIITMIKPSILESRIFNLDINNIKELTDRLKLWKIALVQSKEDMFLGSGTDFLDPSMTSFLIFDLVAPHNMFLHILYSKGIIPLLSVIIILLVTITKSLKVIFNSNRKEDRYIVSCLLCSLISLLGSGVTESLFVNTNLKILFMLLIALSIFFVNGSNIKNQGGEFYE